MIGTIGARHHFLEEVVKANMLSVHAANSIQPKGLNPIILDPPIEIGRVILPIDHERGLIIRDERGYPLTPGGDIDWEKTAMEKQSIIEKFERIERQGSSRKPHKKHPTNYTPPKKKRRK